MAIASSTVSYKQASPASIPDEKELPQIEKSSSSRAYSVFAQVCLDSYNHLAPLCATPYAFGEYAPIPIAKAIVAHTLIEKLPEDFSIQKKLENAWENFKLLGEPSKLYEAWKNMPPQPFFQWPKSKGEFCAKIYNGIVSAHFLGLYHYLYAESPDALETHLGIETALGLGSLYYSYSAARKGVERIQESFNPEEKEPVAKLTSGVALITLGSFGGILVAHQLGHLVEGFEKTSMYPKWMQQKVIAGKAIRHMTGNKTCEAVVIDGVLPRVHPLTSGLGEVYNDLFKLCNVQVIEALTFGDLEEQLNTFKLKSIKNLVFIGHANNELMEVGDKVTLVGNKSLYRTRLGWMTVSPEIFKKYIAENGNVILTGCNTATESPFQQQDFATLAQKFSMDLPDVSVSGAKAFYNPYFANTQLKDGKLDVKMYFPLDMYGNIGLEDKMVHFKNGQKVKG